MIIDEKDHELSHYGVKGQKWGVRRKRTSSSDHTSVQALRKKRVHELSTNELNKITNRKRAEAEYRRATTSKGRAALSKALGSLGKQVMAKVIEQAATAIAKNLVEGGLDLAAQTIPLDLNLDLEK